VKGKTIPNFFRIKPKRDYNKQQQTETIFPSFFPFLLPLTGLRVEWKNDVEIHWKYHLKAIKKILIL
jgi:hypothetical protein